MAGNSSLIAQHALALYGENETHQKFTGAGMRRGLHQRDRMNVSDHRLVENVLHGAALVFDAGGDVRVGIGHGVKLARG